MAPKSHNVKRETNTIIIIITNMNSSNLFLMVLRTLHILTCLISAANHDGKYFLFFLALSSHLLKKQ